MIETPPIKSKATRLGKLFEKHGIKLSRKEQLEYIAHLEGAANWAHLLAEHPQLSSKEQSAGDKPAKEGVLATEPSPVLRAFLDTLTELDTHNNPQGYNWQDGRARLGWKLGRRVMVVEKELRERLMQKLPELLRLDYANRTPRFLHPATDDLIQELVERNWLVLEMEDSRPSMTARVTLKEGFGLWDVYLGQSWQPDRVLVVDIPEKFVDRLPLHDSCYHFTFEVPQFICRTAEVFVQETTSLEDTQAAKRTPTILARKDKPVRLISLCRAESNVDDAAISEKDEE